MGLGAWRGAINSCIWTMLKYDIIIVKDKSMTFEQRIQRRLQEYRKMAATFRETERECLLREDKWEAEMNMIEAMAYERFCADLAHDLAARDVKSKPRKPPPPDDLIEEVPF